MYNIKKKLEDLTQEELEEIRMFFFSTQGYMETDSVCLAYWDKTEDKHYGKN